MGETSNRINIFKRYTFAFLAWLRVFQPAAGKHGEGEYGVSYSGEEGGFIFVQLYFERPGGASLIKATFDFSNLGFNVTDDAFDSFPANQPGIDSFTSFTNSIDEPAVFGVYGRRIRSRGLLTDTGSQNWKSEYTDPTSPRPFRREANP